MIRLLDAATLALTKLRTRKVRLVVTIVISGLLFGGLAGASMVARGVMNGLNSFGKEGLGGHYIAQASPQLAGPSVFEDQSIMDRALAIQKDTVARKKAEAKRLGLEYDPPSEPQPVVEYDAPGGGKQRNLDFQHPASQQAIAEHMAAHPSAGEQEFVNILKKYQTKGHYRSKQLSFDLNGVELQVLKGGKEEFDRGKAQFAGPPTGIDTFVGSWQIMSSDLLTPFTLPGQNLKQGTDGTIPMIVPYSAAEELLGLKKLPPSAKASERLARTKEVRQRAAQVAFSVCYRNQTSANLAQQALSQQQDVEKNKNNKSYQKPSLMYGLPTEACAAVPVVRDVRTKDEKAVAAKQLEFDTIFGQEAPEQAKLSFRIVGIVPDADYGLAAAGVGQIVRSLVTSSLGNGWYAPVELIDQNPLLAKLFNHPSVFGTFESYYADFTTAAEARRFLDTERCQPDMGKSQDLVAVCAAKGKPFNTNPFGSNNLALESAKRGFGKVFKLAALVVAFIAGIIMMGTVGRMIADSRRETAVFRAIGAKKLDISQIYVLYTICLSLLIYTFAVFIGLIGALVLQHHFGQEVTLQALVAYNAQDLSKVFHLYSFYMPDMLYLLGLAIGAGLLSAVIPLFRNLRRNPIRDMRDDT